MTELQWVWRIFTWRKAEWPPAPPSPGLPPRPVKKLTVDTEHQIQPLQSEPLSLCCCQILNNFVSTSHKPNLEPLGTWTSASAPPFFQSPAPGTHLSSFKRRKQLQPLNQNILFATLTWGGGIATVSSFSSASRTWVAKSFKVIPSNISESFCEKGELYGYGQSLPQPQFSPQEQACSPPFRLLEFVSETRVV